MDSNLLILGAVLYMNTYNGSKLFLVWGDSVNPEYPGNIQIHDRLHDENVYQI